MGPGKVEVQSIDFPKLALGSRQCHHGVILKIVCTNICGSDQHMVRGRTTAPTGLILGHEITGEVLEAGRDVEFIKVGDLVSVPFNIACGRCRNCREGKTGICLNVNPARPGAAYGYVDMGGWVGGCRVRDGAVRRFRLLKLGSKGITRRTAPRQDRI
jgi:glutathione-independent formaldehyde dehydrogenase